MTFKIVFTILVFSLLTGCKNPAAPDPDYNDGDNLPDPSQAPALKSVFEEHFVIGAALNSRQFNETDNRARPIIAKHFNTITPENHMKWDFLQPFEGNFTFESADQYIAFGVEHDMHIISHTLVWHNQTPDWVFERLNGSPMVPGNAGDRELLLERMEDHITTVVTRYKDEVDGWDVVNEAVDTGSGGVDGLRNSLWHQIIGPEFIAKAFEFAHAADPDAELYYNDYSLAAPDKRQRTVRLVQDLLEANVPITGVGMQAHYGMDWPTPASFRASIEAFADLGMDVAISELDINIVPPTSPDPYPGGLPQELRDALANRYRELFEVMVEQSDKISRVTFWGVTDGDSWLNGFQGERTNYPLLFDRNGNPKEAFYSVVEAAE